MTNVCLGDFLVTFEFYKYVAEEVYAIYGDSAVRCVIDSIEYKRWNDYDQPGLDERIYFESTDGKKYGASMTHKRDQFFWEVTC